MSPGSERNLWCFMRHWGIAGSRTGQDPRAAILLIYEVGTTQPVTQGGAFPGMLRCSLQLEGGV